MTRVPGAQESPRLPVAVPIVVETPVEPLGNAELTGSNCPTICPTCAEIQEEMRDLLHSLISTAGVAEGEYEGEPTAFRWRSSRATWDRIEALWFKLSGFTHDDDEEDTDEVTP